MKLFSRRDFLKASATVAATALLHNQLSALNLQPDRPNIILLVMDSLSAGHMSLYGYPRTTTPNIDAFAESSTVFHRHYAGGNFTTTATASMLTGMNAWNHRAINGGGVTASKFTELNLFTLLGLDYERFAFAQTPYADILLSQYYRDIDRILSPFSYSLLEKEGTPPWSTKNDRELSAIDFNGFLFPFGGKDLPGSLLFGYLNKSHFSSYAGEKNAPYYSRGLPEIMPGLYFRNEEVYHGVHEEVLRMHHQRLPYFAYFHLFSPHSPYAPRDNYRKLFQDQYKPIIKPLHYFKQMDSGLDQNAIEDIQLKNRTYYDRQIAQVDEEFGRLIARLRQEGALDNTYIILTSDHGELFERGFVGHGFEFMYEEVLHIPLIIYAPGQTKREDVFSITGNTDLFSTILSFAGKDYPGDLDGRILPGFGGRPDGERPIFSMVATENSAFAPIKKAVIAMYKGSYKLIAYMGYKDIPEPFELYQLENDPDELINLASKETRILSLMKDELQTHLNQSNRRFIKK